MIEKIFSGLLKFSWLLLLVTFIFGLLVVTDGGIKVEAAAVEGYRVLNCTPDSSGVCQNGNFTGCKSVAGGTGNNAFCTTAKDSGSLSKTFLVDECTGSECEVDGQKYTGCNNGVCTSVTNSAGDGSLTLTDDAAGFSDDKADFSCKVTERTDTTLGVSDCTRNGATTRNDFCVAFKTAGSTEPRLDCTPKAIVFGGTTDNTITAWDGGDCYVYKLSDGGSYCIKKAELADICGGIPILRDIVRGTTEVANGGINCTGVQTATEYLSKLQERAKESSFNGSSPNAAELVGKIAPNIADVTTNAQTQIDTSKCEEIADGADKGKLRCNGVVVAKATDDKGGITYTAADGTVYDSSGVQKVTQASGGQGVSVGGLFSDIFKGILSLVQNILLAIFKILNMLATIALHIVSFAFLQIVFYFQVTAIYEAWRLVASIAFLVLVVNITKAGIDILIFGSNSRDDLKPMKVIANTVIVALGIQFTFILVLSAAAIMHSFAVVLIYLFTGGEPEKIMTHLLSGVQSFAALKPGDSFLTAGYSMQFDEITSALAGEALMFVVMIYMIYIFFQAFVNALVAKLLLSMLAIFSPVLLVLYFSPFPKGKEMALKGFKLIISGILFDPTIIAGLIIVSTISRAFGPVITESMKQNLGGGLSEQTAALAAALTISIMVILLLKMLSDFITGSFKEVIDAGVGAVTGTISSVQKGWSDTRKTARTIGKGSQIVAGTVTGALKTVNALTFKPGAQLAGSAIQGIGDKATAAGATRTGMTGAALRWVGQGGTDLGKGLKMAGDVVDKKVIDGVVGNLYKIPYRFTTALDTGMDIVEESLKGYDKEKNIDFAEDSAAARVRAEYKIAQAGLKGALGLSNSEKFQAFQVEGDALKEVEKKRKDEGQGSLLDQTVARVAGDAASKERGVDTKIKDEFSMEALLDQIVNLPSALNMTDVHRDALKQALTDPLYQAKLVQDPTYRKWITRNGENLSGDIQQAIEDELPVLLANQNTASQLTRVRTASVRGREKFNKLNLESTDILSAYLENAGPKEKAEILAKPSGFNPSAIATLRDDKALKQRMSDRIATPQDQNKVIAAVNSSTYDYALAGLDQGRFFVGFDKKLKSKPDAKIGEELEEFTKQEIFGVAAPSYNLTGEDFDKYIENEIEAIRSLPTSTGKTEEQINDEALQKILANRGVAGAISLDPNFGQLKTAQTKIETIRQSGRLLVDNFNQNKEQEIIKAERRFGAVQMIGDELQQSTVWAKKGVKDTFEDLWRNRYELNGSKIDSYDTLQTTLEHIAPVSATNTRGLPGSLRVDTNVEAELSAKLGMTEAYGTIANRLKKGAGLDDANPLIKGSDTKFYDFNEGQIKDKVAGTTVTKQPLPPGRIEEFANETMNIVHAQLKRDVLKRQGVTGTALTKAEDEVNKLVKSAKQNWTNTVAEDYITEQVESGNLLNNQIASGWGRAQANDLLKNFVPDAGGVDLDTERVQKALQARENDAKGIVDAKKQEAQEAAKGAAGSAYASYLATKAGVASN